MMIAAPPSVWSFLDGRSPGQVAELLNTLATKVPVERMLRSRRGPKKPRTTRKTSGRRNHHVATKKLLDKSREVPLWLGLAQRIIRSQFRLIHIFMFTGVGGSSLD